MKDCYAVHVIRWFNRLPDKDDRCFLIKFWHWLRKKNYMTKEKFFLCNVNSLPRHIVDNRAAWSNEDLGYE